MADRPPSDENMAVSQDPGVSQQNLKESNKEETDLRGAQSNSKMDAPKKKTFKITSVTKSSQRGGSGDLTQDNDGDSIDDLDETVDSHTEDLSSEMYDCSKATDLDGQDALLTPEEVIKEKPARFKVVKIGTKETFRRGRWTCYDYPDAPEKPEKVEPKPEESHAAGGVQNSVHYGHGFDDPLKNPLLAGATGTMPSHQSSGPADSMSGTTKGPGESQSRQSSLSGIAQHSNQAGQSVQNAIATYSNHVAQSMPAYSVANALPYSTKGGQQVPAYSMQGMVPGQSIGQPGPSGQPLRAGMSAPNLPQQQTGGQTVTSQSVAGSIQGTQQQPPQQQPGSQASTIPANVHSQPAPASGAAQASQPQVPGAMQRGEYMNSAAQSMGQPPPSQQSAQQQQQQQPVYDATAQQPGGGYNLVSSGSGALPNLQNAMTTSTTDTSMEPGTAVDPKSVSAAPSQTAITPGHLDGNEIGDDMLGLGPGLEPLQIAVGGITNPNPEDDITTEEA
ncbi:hypothetical protein BaRGS_00037341 [Batillaria attramentaria]|uniref:Uncharacterized protein n=1 Tax=Batillaria attramentaria TaxID=370345 RepID=A0ABD0J953_9CAEN